MGPGSLFLQQLEFPLLLMRRLVGRLVGRHSHRRHVRSSMKSEILQPKAHVEPISFQCLGKCTSLCGSGGRGRSCCCCCCHRAATGVVEAAGGEIWIVGFLCCAGAELLCSMWSALRPCRLRRHRCRRAECQAAAAQKAIALCRAPADVLSVAKEGC